MILGKHRSGTSAVTGSLQQSGLYLGKVLSYKFALNPTGLREPEALMHMHENLLEANGGSWNEPPELPVNWGKLHTAVRDLFIESRSGHGQWGFKEPRTLLVYEGWIEALTDWTAVGVFRDPAEVARSLQARNGFEPEKGFRLWTTYNQRLLDLQKAHGFPLIEYSGDPERMFAGLARARRWLGLAEATEEPLYQPQHRRSDGTGLEVPSATRDLFEQLCCRAVSDAP